MKKSDLIYDELQIYQDILNYQITGLAAPELQYTKQQIQQLNKKCDKLYTDYMIQLEKEKQANNTNKNVKWYWYLWYLLPIAWYIYVIVSYK